jgi:hypothetical protein
MTSVLPHQSLLTTETDDRRANPQTQARVYLRRVAEVLPRGDISYAQVKQSYLERFSEAELIQFGRLQYLEDYTEGREICGRFWSRI